MTFYINDELVLNLDDDSFSSGYAGLCAYDDYNTIVEFDNAILYPFMYTASENVEAKFELIKENNNSRR